jgi:hypothetical protein
MKKSRRTFIKASAALGALSVMKPSGVFAAAPVLKTVGFVVSTPIQPKHLAAFEQALDANGWQTASQRALVDPDSAGGAYGPAHNELKKIAQGHIDLKADLIVAAGGLPAAVAVAAAVKSNLGTAPPFIFLIGRYPASGEADGADLYDCPTSKKVGGVNQDVPAQNPSNFTLLNSKSGGVVTIGTVGLIVNKNNPITEPEVAVWKAQGGINEDLIFYLKGENNDNNSMRRLLGDISNQTLNGIVVSSDAFLRSKGRDFDARLRTSAGGGGGGFRGWACYPYNEYLFQTPGEPGTPGGMYSMSTPALAVDDLQDQNTAYYKLGLKAAQVLSNTLTSTQALTTWTKDPSTSSYSWKDGAFPP